MRNTIRRYGTDLAVLRMGIVSLMIGMTTQAMAASRGAPLGVSYLPDVPVLTQDGHAMRFYDDLVTDKVVVINTISTRCTACLPETKKLAQVQQLLGGRIGNDIFFYSITSDPERDTPAILRDYAQKLHAGPGWLFLTGQQADIAILVKSLGFQMEGDLDESSSHSANLLIGSGATRHWRWRSAADDAQPLALTIDTFFSSGGPRQPGGSYAEVAPLSVKGQSLFAARCSLCHTIGQGDGDGPDLQGVTARRERGWLARWLAKPDKMLAERDPIAMSLYVKYKNEMPNLLLGAPDVEALVTYLEAKSVAQ